MKMKAYTVCARAQASIFMVFWPFSQKKIVKLLKKSERWPNKWSKVKTLEDKPRSGWPFFHKLCEKYHRKSCTYMRNNSTKQKGKKFPLHIVNQSFEHNSMGISYRKKLESLEQKKAVHTSCKHGVRRICQLYIPKEDRPANSRDVNPLETIWIIVDETYKDPAPKTLDKLRQWLRFDWRMWIWTRFGSWYILYLTA